LDLYNALAADGRLERIQSFLKKGVSILGYRSYDAECAKNKKSSRYTVCIDLNDVTDPEKFKTADMIERKLPPKKWIQFEIPMDALLGMCTNRGNRHQPANHHQLVRMLGYKFSGNGHFDVYLDGAVDLNETNKNMVYLWMPVVQ